MTGALPPGSPASRGLAPDLEIWRLTADRAALRLLDLGRRGVAGFVDGGRDEEGAWLARRPASPALAAWLDERPGPVEARLACALAASLAGAAAACEQASLFPGAIAPDSLIVRGDSLEIRAESLAHAMTGRGSAPPSPPGARWLPPEQAGRPADSASNRYAIGLVLYRLLAGEHPFAGRGLRRGLDDQAQRGAPPMPDAITSAMPPGLHGFCLRMLDPDPAQRPASSADIAGQLRGLLSERAPSRPAPLPIEPPPIAPRVAPPAPRSRRLHSLAALAPIAAAIVVAAWAIDRLGAAPAGATVAPRAMASAREVADCASCHPRQSAEWSRSVMAHAADSPLFQSLEILIQEQVGRDRDCPGGAGVLREAGPGACRSRATGRPITGSGGELWCVNCHSAGENLGASLPAWDGRSVDASSRRPLRDLLSPSAMEGIGCAVCHQAIGPVHPGNEAAGLYEGNPSWIAADSGRRFLMRPEDERGTFGIANSGYFLDPKALLARGKDLVANGSHAATTPAARAYLASSEFCGACHDVRLFGTDALAGVQKGEHFKRLRNAYSEWAAWSEEELRAGRKPASCQDCHMSTFPGVCVPGKPSPAPPLGPVPATRVTAAERGCPPGTIFEPREPGVFARGRAAAGSGHGRVSPHYFSGVDIPLAQAFDGAAIGEPTLDVHGIPLGARQRRDLLLARTFRLELEPPRRSSGRLEIPLVIENVGAGHRVPAGFSQEREFWIHLTVTDRRGRVVYEVGRVDRGDQDLRDKVFLRVNTDSGVTDGLGRPLGLFGADVADGPDHPEWSPPPILGGTSFRGRGLINMQNGFLRCVRCIGLVDPNGRCQPSPGQEGRRAARYTDGDYDIETGECRSNLRGMEAFLETFFPIGALDASRGLVKGPDAIIDTRSAPPGKPLRYVYELDTAETGPLRVEARLLFRAFPPFLLRAFIDYEAAQDRRGLRPSGPLIGREALDRLDVVEIATARVTVE